MHCLRTCVRADVCQWFRLCMPVCAEGGGGGGGNISCCTDRTNEANSEACTGVSRSF